MAMARFLWRAVALVGAVILLLAPLVGALVPQDTSAGPDPVRITDYDAQYRVDADGTLHAEETITAMFPFGRHGIFRFWDLKDVGDPHVRLKPKDVDITLDGHDVPVDMQWQSGRRYRVAKVGDPDSTLPPGSHTYRITYRIEGALAPSDETSGTSSSWAGTETRGSVFDWQVVAGGWAMGMDQARVTVKLPKAVEEAQCAVANGTPCRVDGLGTDTLSLQTGALEPYTRVTMRADVPVEAPDRDGPPWDITWDRLLGRSLSAVLVVGAISVVALGFGYLWDRRSHRYPKPSATTEIAPTTSTAVRLRPRRRSQVMSHGGPSRSGASTGTSARIVTRVYGSSAPVWMLRVSVPSPSTRHGVPFATAHCASSTAFGSVTVTRAWSMPIAHPPATTCQSNTDPRVSVPAQLDDVPLVSSDGASAPSMR
jgi:hypothetical protein